MAAASPASLAADTVAALLLDPVTRVDTIDALEMHNSGTPHDEPLALAAIVALSELMTLDASECGLQLFQRAGSLRGRLVAEATDQARMWATAQRDGRMEAIASSSANVLAQIVAKAPDDLDQQDAMSFACFFSMEQAGMSHGLTRACVESHDDTLTYFGRWGQCNPLGL